MTVQPGSPQPSPVAQDTIVYQGQFGPFTLTDRDRREVVEYRIGLGIAALCFALGVAWLWWSAPEGAAVGTVFYAGMVLGLGISLWRIHIYLAVLHRTLQVFWAIGALASVAIAWVVPKPLLLTVAEQPLTLLGIGWVAAALTGIFFKEAFCFNRLETKLLTPLVPVTLLGHLLGVVPPVAEQWLLTAWAVLFGIFALRKAVQAIPPDIGDKSVFEYLKHRPSSPTSTAAPSMGDRL